MSATEFHFSAAEEPLFDAVGSEYVRHLETLRGLIRSEVTRANLLAHLESNKISTAIDIGAGAGGDASWLASLGIDVLMVEPSSAMRAEAHANLLKETREVQSKITTHDGDIDSALRQFRDHGFDLVVCHGVLMYQDDPGTFVGKLSRLSRQNGLVSLLTKNAGSLAFRPARDYEFTKALSLLNGNGSRGNLGVDTAAHSLQEVADWLFDCGLFLEEWYGVRVFFDHLADVAPESETVREILELETAASRKDPYRSASRLLHVVARNERPELSD